MKLQLQLVTCLALECNAQFATNNITPEQSRNEVNADAYEHFIERAMHLMPYRIKHN